MAKAAPYLVGRLAGKQFLKAKWMWQSVTGNENEAIQAEQAVGRDMATLLFGFCVIWAYMVWSQYVVIWHGDLPEEIGFIIRRMRGSWAPVTWLVFVMAFFVPFIGLLNRAVKSYARGLSLVSLVTIIGVWLERFVLVSPSIWHLPGIPLGIIELLITSGVFGLFVVCYTLFLQTFPALVISDPRLDKASTVT